jgi:hypothetical protein
MGREFVGHKSLKNKGQDQGPEAFDHPDAGWEHQGIRGEGADSKE